MKLYERDKKLVNQVKGSPFVKWAGGKRNLIPEIERLLPKEFVNYFEAFTGGGALFYYMAHKYQETEKVFNLSDINLELVVTYKVVKNDLEELLKRLAELEKSHSKDQYLEIRKRNKLIENKLHLKEFPYLKEILKDYYRESKEESRKTIESISKEVKKLAEREKSSESFRKKIIKLCEGNDLEYKLKDPIDMAARFIYLNKTCFNGLYRVNRKGEFNTPMGRSNSLNILDEKVLKRASKWLSLANIRHQTYCNIKPKSGDLVYLDPPYDPLKETSFTTYTKFDFTREDQVKLRDFAKSLKDKGVKVMLSNSDTEFIREIYSSAGFKIHEVFATRSINRDKNNRKKVKELIITSY